MTALFLCLKLNAEIEGNEKKIRQYENKKR
jgi:hypothetical protein